MEKRQELKNINLSGYAAVDKEIKRKIWKAKYNWLNSKYEKINFLDSRDDANLHKNSRESAGSYRPKIADWCMETDTPSFKGMRV